MSSLPELNSGGDDLKNLKEANVLDEKNIREEISETINRLYERGLVSSLGGNVSYIFRDKKYVLITPTGLDKKNVEPSDIVKVDLDGQVIGNGVPSSETIVHLKIYGARGDVNAIVHAHPATAVGLVSAGYVPKGVTPEFVVMIGELGVVEFTTPGEKTAKTLAKVLKDHNLVILKNHGAFSVGNSLMQAFSRIEILEEASKMIFVAKDFGGMPEFNQKQIKILLINM